MHSNQKGASAVEAFLLFVIVALIGLVGWYVYQAQPETAVNDSSSSSQTASSDPVPQIQNEDDLKEAEEFLNSSDLDKELDSSEIDAALN